MQISDENLRGLTVVAADGHAIGEVSAVFIETSTWTIASIKIKLSKTAAEQLGASQSLLRAATIELPIRMIQSVGDTVLLSAPTSGLRHTVPEGKQSEGKVA